MTPVIHTDTVVTSVLSFLGAALLLAIIRLLRRLVRSNEEFREDWYGVAARPGREAIPGVPERLGRIEKEFRDSVNRLDMRLERVESVVLRSPPFIAAVQPAAVEVPPTPSQEQP